MAIPVNMGGVPKSGPLPGGLYLVRIDDIEVKPTKDKPQNLNLVVTYTVLDSAGDETYSGRQIKNHYISLTENSRPVLRSFLEATTQEDWTADGMELEPADLVGRCLRLMTYQDEKQYTKISAFYPESGELV